MGPEDRCINIVESTGKPCGADTDGPFDARFCSDECADRINRAELAELGITPEMLKEALDDYYEVKGALEQREQTRTGRLSSKTESDCHAPSSRDKSASS